MGARPPENLARLVRALVPPASREHVLGDLQERYRSPRGYLADALQALPFVIASRLRRTTHPLGVLFVGAFLWWAVFWGNRQDTVLAALLPALITLAALALRDVYRDTTPSWPRAAALDVAIAATCVLLLEGMLWLLAPSLLLTRDTLLIGFPLGFLILFGLRLQTPTGFHQPPGFARSLSLQELRTEITTYETAVRRAIRVEIVACIFVAACFFGFLWAPSPLISRIGGGFTSAAALFIWWFLYRFARVRPIPAELGFTDTVAAYRADLQRRRRLSRSYVWWYVVPLSIGMSLMLIGPQLQRPGSLPGVLLTALVMVAFGTLLVSVQQFAARKAQQRVDQLGLVSEKPQETGQSCLP